MSANPMRQRRIFIGALFAVVLSPVVFLGLLPDAPDQSAFAPTGYDRTIQDLFVQQGWLAPGGNGENVVVLTPAWNSAPPAARGYYTKSFLRRDLALNDARLWRTSGRILGVAYGAHAVASPFAPSGWKGDLGFGDQSSAIGLFNDSKHWRVLLTTQSVVDPHTRNTPLPVEAFGATAPDQDSPATWVNITAHGEIVATIRMIGRHPYIEALGPWIFLGQDDKPLPIKDGAPLFSGSTITVKHDREEIVLRFQADALGFITRQQLLGGRFRHKDYDQFAYDRLARAFEGAMDAAVQGCRDCALEDRSFSLTLSETLNNEVQDFLTARMHGSHYPAAVTIMDAMNGNILALASYDPEGPDGPMPADALHAERLPINQNFELLPIGSTSKPLVSAAILSSWAAAMPQARPLQTMVIRNNAQDGYADSILGISIGEKGLKVDRDGATVDFDGFIGHSSNLYAAALITMGANYPIGDAHQPRVPVGNNFHFDRDTPRLLPFLAFDLVKVGGNIQFAGLRYPPAWMAHYAHMFSIGTDAPGANGDVDLGIWDSILNQARDMHLLAFGSISPALQTWNTDTVHDFRQDYLPIILGGQNYGWPTVKLAEAYARLVTGRAIRAHIVADPAAQFGAVEGYPASIRATICEAMETVVTAPDGTARHLKSTLDRLRPSNGRWVRVYSKTGTPQIEHASPAELRQVEAEGQLIGHHLIRTAVDDQVAIYNGQNQLIGIPQTSADIARMAGALAADPEARRLSGGADFRKAVARAVHFNAAHPEDKAAYYNRSANGQLLSATAPPAHKYDATNGHLYVFVVEVFDTDQQTGCADASPRFAWSVAINVQDGGLDAQSVAQKILNGKFGDMVRASARTPQAPTSTP